MNDDDFFELEYKPIKNFNWSIFSKYFILVMYLFFLVFVVYFGFQVKVYGK